MCVCAYNKKARREREKNKAELPKLLNNKTRKSVHTYAVIKKKKIKSHKHSHLREAIAEKKEMNLNEEDVFRIANSETVLLLLIY